VDGTSGSRRSHSVGFEALSEEVDGEGDGADLDPLSFYDSDVDSPSAIDPPLARFLGSRTSSGGPSPANSDTNQMTGDPAASADTAKRKTKGDHARGAAQRPLTTGIAPHSIIFCNAFFVQPHLCT